MRLEARKLLHDIESAVALIEQFTRGRTFEDYEQDAMLRSAVERQFAIIGEGVARLARSEPDLVVRISDFRQIIDFRNFLIHGYADVNDRLVWEAVEAGIPVLRREIEELQGED